MASTVSMLNTTYAYEPLNGPRYIRLLCIEHPPHNDNDLTSGTYSLVQLELTPDAAPLDFEAISYQWGHHARVLNLELQNAAGSIGLTANLAEALPHLIKQSRTKRLWIDQLCINQSDNTERSAQVGLMSQIYTKASRVLVWLGPADEHSRTCKQWLAALAELLPTLQSAHRVVRESPEYHRDWRQVIVRDTFASPATAPVWAAALIKFWARPWFTRGWIVQEFLLAREVVCLAGDVEFSLQDLDDMFTVPGESDARATLEATNESLGYRVLMTLKTDPFTDTPQPQLFLRIMAAVASEFVTQELGDRLFGFLGMIPGLDFVPDYSKPLGGEFTRFAATLARQYGSIDFLSMWSANLDEMLKDTPPELLGLPSWTPSFSWLPLTAPWRLAVGGVRSWRTVVHWNAAAGRKHMHDQAEDAATTKRLHVRGRIVDYIDKISSARIARYWDTDEAYYTSLVEQIKADLPAFEHWTHVDLIQFLNVVSCNGDPPRESAEQLLGLAPGVFPEQARHLHKYEESLGCCLSMGRGRRFVTTETGRKGLTPFIGSLAKNEERKGSAIVVLHGCIVPMVLQRIDDGGKDKVGEWKVVGDAYIDGLMFGEGVTWAEEDAMEFVLV
ncbi:hypothetical protein ACN47E_002898 [Coniothyrium glycines]